MLRIHSWTVREGENVHTFSHSEGHLCLSGRISAHLVDILGNILNSLAIAFN